MPACSSDAPAMAATNSNGVNDVAAACGIRATWTHALSDPCTLCRGLATTPYCSCFGNDESAKCEVQQNAKTAEKSCADAVNVCVGDCHENCGCIDACYEKAPACRVKAAAVDGCVVDVCDKACR